MSLNRSIPPRYFEREFGIEFAPFEWKRKEAMRNTIKVQSHEVSGYVRWFPARTGYLLVPTLTTSEPRIFCYPAPFGKQELPPERSFIIAKGSWTLWPNGTTNPSRRFAVEEFNILRPEIGDIKPDLSYRDCREILFEALSVPDEPLKDLVTYSFISSPTALGRTGGLSLSLYNEYDNDKRGQSGMLQKYLLGFLPAEVVYSRSMPLAVEGTSMSVTMEPFNWSYKSYRTDGAIPKEAFGILNRIGASADIVETSVSMFSKHNKPRSLNDPVVTFADAPIVVTRDVEKKSGSFDPSPKVFQFMVATHMVQSILPEPIYESSLSYIRQELTRLTDEYPLLKKHLGKGSILDLGVYGRPMSLLHLGLSDGRACIQEKIDNDNIRRVVELFRNNADNTMAVWEMTFPNDAKYNLSSLAPEERRILSYIVRNGPSSQRDIFESCKENMSETVFLRMWNSLHNGGLIFEASTGIFDIVPNLTDL